MTFMRWRLLAFPFLAILLAACGRGPAAPAAPASYAEAMAQASKSWALNRWSEVFAACELAFRYADREGDSKVIGAVDCVGESAARMGKPELALPHHERLFEAYADRLKQASGRHRLANNLGVLLIRKGHREQGIAVLREALEVYAGTPYHIGSQRSFPARAMIVKNLARAWYDTASDLEARAWVREQGAAFLEQMQGHERGVHLRMGASSAMDALVLIGRRQANTDTPAWEAIAREWEPLEAEIDARSPQLARGCENIPLREILLEACMRELAPPA
jgi:tetratricopeptide (TPR) repeat protein